MEKEFVPYEESYQLKTLGFAEPCFAYYGEINGGEIELFLKRNFDTEAKYLLAPTYSQAFRWFRENYKLQTYIDFYHSESYFYKIKSQDGRNIGNTGDIILQGSPLFTRTYKEAELACLCTLIEIVKNK